MMAQSPIPAGSSFNIDAGSLPGPTKTQSARAMYLSFLGVNQQRNSHPLTQQPHPAIIMDPPIGVIGPIHLKLAQSVSLRV